MPGASAMLLPVFKDALIDKFPHGPVDCGTRAAEFDGQFDFSGHARTGRPDILPNPIKHVGFDILIACSHPIAAPSYVYC